MTFNSYVFVLLFLPLCLFGYFTLNKFRLYRLGLTFLLGMSLWFYGYFHPWYLLVICCSVLVNYIIYRILHGMTIGGTVAARKIVFITGIVFNLGVLGYFKYSDFFIENINLIFKTDFTLRHILLPLGISFFTFQQISFIVDVYMDRGGVFYIRFLSMRRM